MQNVQSLILNISENSIMNIVFDACRANEKREPRTVGAYYVKFRRIANTNDLGAYVYRGNANGSLVGRATVDEFDV